MNNFRLTSIGYSILMSALICFGTTGCSGLSSPLSSKKATESSVVIPDLPTAREQFQYAKGYAGTQIISMDEKKRAEQMRNVISTYERVLNNFPQDTEYCSLALLEIGDCTATSGDLHGAYAFYERARQMEQNDFVQARALVSQVRIRDRQKNYAEGKILYKQVHDKYLNSENALAREIARKSEIAYLRAQETE